MKKITSKSEMRRLVAQDPDLELHFKDCDIWMGKSWDCTCIVRFYGLECDDEEEN